MIFIDTETTGITDTDEILSIAIVDDEGTTLLDTYLTPTGKREWPEAQERNGITPEFIFDGHFPTAADIKEQVWQIIGKDDIVCYNADFDLPFIERAWWPEGLHDEFCCMLAFAIYRGSLQRNLTTKLVSVHGNLLKQPSSPDSIGTVNHTAHWLTFRPAVISGNGWIWRIECRMQISCKI